MITVFSDITERKKNEEILKLSEKKLREANQAKDKFFSIIAHDLMNPFNALSGFTGLLIDSIRNCNTEEVLKYAQLIEYSSRRIYELLQNLLIWSRSQSGKIVFSPSRVHLAGLVSDSIEVLRSIALTKKMEIVTELDETLMLFVDRNMMETVIRNLVSNAIKFSEPESNVSIYVKSTDTDVEFCVVDTGIGMDEQQISELFSLNKKETVSHSRGGDAGIGLGLVLCHEFVTIHGGKIWAESEPGKGSRFYFTLPRNLHPEVALKD
ncbi:MAG TPA: HAMP domain-containing sensor histidine kinase [Prolixibacteraceae bacterium]|nr:HAMP domain-containing sensor histidine kinase [Prolixibacteraceae bacterium]